MKYTAQYCRENKVVIKVNSKEEGNQIIKYFKPDAEEHSFHTIENFPYYLIYSKYNSTYLIDWVPTCANKEHLNYIKNKEHKMQQKY